MKRKCLLFCLGIVLATARTQAGSVASVNGISVRDGWVTVTPTEFQGAINNPLKGFPQAFTQMIEVARRPRR